MRKRVGQQKNGILIATTAVLWSFQANTAAAEAIFPAPSAALQDSFSTLNEAWATSPLAFNKVLFTASQATGYGQYTQRSAPAFAAGEMMHVYAEPVSFGFAETGGTYAYSLVTDFQLLTNSGQVLVEEKGFARFNGSSAAPRRELPTALSFQFDGLPSGSYLLELTYTDNVADKSAKVRLPFSVVAAE